MGFLDTSARIRRAVVTELDLLPAENYRKTLAAGVAGFAVGDAFCSDQKGEMRRYERIAAAPGYLDLGDEAAPASRKRLDAGLLQEARARDALRGVFDTRVPIVAIEELGGKGDFDPVTMTGTDNSPAFAKARQLGVGVLLSTAKRYGISDEILTYSNMRILGDDAFSPEIWAMFPTGGKKMIHSDLTNPDKTVNVVLDGFTLVRRGTHAEHGGIIDNLENVHVRIRVLSDGLAPGGAFGVSCFYPENRPSKNCHVELVEVTGGNNFALQFGNVDGGRMRIGATDCAREAIGLEPYALAKYRFAGAAVVGDTVSWPAHGLSNAYPVIYSREAGTAIPGLSGRANGWFAIVVDANTIKIAASKEDAIARVAVSLGTAPAGYHALYKCGILRNIIVEASFIDTGDITLNGSATGAVIATATSGGYIEGVKMLPWTAIERNPTSGSTALTVLGVRGFNFGNLTAIGHKNAAVLVGNGTLNGIKDASGDISPKNQDGSAVFGLQLFSEGTVENVNARGFLKDGMAITGDIIIRNADLRSSVATGRAIKLAQDSEFNFSPLIENVTTKVPALVPIATELNGALVGPVLRQRGCINLNDETATIDYVATRFIEQKLTKALSNIAAAKTTDANKTTLAGLRSANVNRSASVFSGRVRVVARTNASTTANIAVYDLAITKAALGSGTGQAATVSLKSSEGLAAGSSASWPSFEFGITSLGELGVCVIGSTAVAGPYIFEIESRGDLLLT